jgi:hypothetical protein
MAHPGCDKSENIIAQGGLKVCDAAHSLFVMKKASSEGIGFRRTTRGWYGKWQFFG